MNKSILPTNDKDQRHGYWQWYYKDRLVYKCTYYNDKEIGYEEYHGTNGKLLLYKIFHII